MAVLTKTFAFTSNAEGFVATSASGITLSYDSTTGNPAGSLKASTTAKGQSAVQNYWQYEGTWESLGVPANSIVTGIRVLSASTRCVSRSNHAQTTIIGPYEIRDSGDALIGTLWSGREATAAEGSWTVTAAQPNVAIVDGQQPSNATVRIRLADTIATGGGGGTPSVALHDDQVSLEITYTPPVTLKAGSDTGAHSTVESATLFKVDTIQKAGSDTVTHTTAENATLVKTTPPAEITVADFVAASSFSEIPAVAYNGFPQIDDLVVVMASSDGASSALGGVAFSGAVGSQYTIENSQAGFIAVAGRVTTPEMFTATPTMPTGGQAVGEGGYTVMYILRGVDHSFEAATHGFLMENIESNYSANTVFDSGLEIVFARSTQPIFYGFDSSVGTMYDMNAQQIDIMYGGTGYVKNRGPANQGYMVSISGEELRSGILFGAEFKPLTTATKPILRDFEFAENGRNVGTSTSVSLTSEPGDILVVKTGCEGAGSPTSISGGGLTWTSRAALVGSGTQSDARIWTAVANAPGPITITAEWSRTDLTRSMLAESWVSAKLAATPASVAVKDGSAPSATVTTTAANSVISWASIDWNAIGGFPSYRNSPVLERLTGTANSDYRGYYAWQNVPTAGATVFGMTAPTGQSPSMVGIEVQFDAGIVEPPVDKAGSDSGTETAAESVSTIATSTTRVDSGSHSAADTAQTLITSIRTDSGTHSAVETSVVGSSLTRTDAGTHSATEASALFINNSLSLVDSGAHSTTETAQVTSVLDRTDTGTHSVTDTSSMFISESKSLADSGTLSATEGRSISGTATAADSGTHTTTDSATLFKTISLNDSGTHSATETSSAFNNRIMFDSGTHIVNDSAVVAITGTIPKPVTDSGTHSAMDSAVVNISSFLDRVDTGTHSATESVSIFATLVRSDAGTVSVTEASTNSLTLSRADAGTISATDASSLSVVLSTSDSGSISATDSASPQVSVGVSDAGTHTATEAYSLFVTRTLTDAGTHSASEVSGSSLSTSVTENPTWSATESAAVVVSLTRSDSGSTFLVVETSSSFMPYSELSRADSGTLSVTETATISVTLAASDSGIVSATEGTSGYRTIALTDSGTLSVTEASTRAVDYDASDSGTHSATETSSVFVNDAKTLTDTGTHSAAEGRSISGTATAADSGTLSAADSSIVFKMIAVSDSVTHSALDTSVVFNDRLSADLGIHSTSETSGVFISGLVVKGPPGAPAQDGSSVSTDAGTHSVLEQTPVVKATLARSDTGSHSVTETTQVRVTISRSDSGTHIGDEVPAPMIAQAIGDYGNHSVTESATVVVRDMQGYPIEIWNGTEMEEASLSIWDGQEFYTPVISFWNGTGWA